MRCPGEIPADKHKEGYLHYGERKKGLVLTSVTQICAGPQFCHPPTRATLLWIPTLASRHHGGSSGAPAFELRGASQAYTFLAIWQVWELSKGSVPYCYSTLELHVCPLPWLIVSDGRSAGHCIQVQYLRADSCCKIRRSHSPMIHGLPQPMNSPMRLCS